MANTIEGTIEKDSKMLSWRRRAFFAFLAACLSTLFALSICEVVFRILEHHENSKNIYEGDGGKWIEDARWGWKPSVGSFRNRHFRV